MRFHGLMLVRDEADVIAENLQHVLDWADDVFIFDTGSTDGTWEIITGMAARDTRLKPLERKSVVYGNPLRAYVFEWVRATFSEGDWVVKLDADEFFHTSPPEFVAHQLGRNEACVWLQWYFFRLTTLEVNDYEAGRVDLLADRRRPIAERRRYFKMPTHSEPRMFRYRRGMKWSETDSFPHYAGCVARERILIRHYPHRDPVQMRERYELRAAMKRLGSPAGPHWTSKYWRDDLIVFDGDLANAREHSAAGEGLSAVSGHISGPLHFWEPGSTLPAVLNHTHLKPLAPRLAQAGFYSCCVGIADRVTPGITPKFVPAPISEMSRAGKGMVIAGRRSFKGCGAFRGIMLVRDEDDIIEQCLKHLLTWIDAAYVLDLGSTDKTWELIQDAASRDRRIIPVQSAPYIFKNSLRGYVFEKFRHKFRDRDWVLRLDADELYHVAPPEFVRERLSVRETCVYLGWYFFRLTSKECEDYESGRVDVANDRARSVTERRRFFKLTEHTEPRMFRYRSSMKWTPAGSFPLHAGYVARERIPIRHYPHRDPLQMEKRYALRTKMLQLNSEAFPQWNLDDWRKEVIDFDPKSMISKERTTAGEGLSATAGHTTGPLYEWKAGTALPEISGSSHLSPYARRLVQRTIHSPFLSIIDHFRSGWPQGFEPQRLGQA